MSPDQLQPRFGRRESAVDRAALFALYAQAAIARLALELIVQHRLPGSELTSLQMRAVALEALDDIDDLDAIGSVEV